MAPAHSTRRPVLPLLLLGAAAWVLSSVSFVGAPALGQERGSRVAAHVSAGYLERLGPKDSDIAFKASAATGATVDVEYKKRPFGILRYQPGEGGVGAMVMEVVPKSRYPGDPQGQAFVNGVKGGWVLKSVSGTDVLGMPFGKIMDMLDDEVADPRFSKSTALALTEQGGRMAEPVETPIKLTYATIPGYEFKGAELKESAQDGFAR